MASRGPGVLRLSEEMSGIRQFKLKIDMARGLCVFDPASAFKLSAVQRGVSSCSHLTLCRDPAKQGRVSEPVASCSSPRVGRRTSVRIPACRPVSRRSGNSCEAGSRCFATPTGAAHRKCCARYRKVSSWRCGRFPVFCTVTLNDWFHPSSERLTVGSRLRQAAIGAPG